MRILLIAVAALTLATVAQAGIVGWLSAKKRDWQFVQDRGGVRISASVEREGKKVLPVEFVDKVDSALVVRGVELKRKGTQIVIRIVTQLVEKDSKYSPVHFAALTGVPAGSYDVYYETAGDPAKLLGHIDLK